MDVLLEQFFLLRRADDKTNIFLPFQLIKPYRRLMIHWRYTPHLVTDNRIAAYEIERCCQRYLPEGKWPNKPIHPDAYDPLFNFVTLSLDSPAGYVGCAHRHDADMRLTVSETDASPGLEPCPICPGPWRAALHVHAVIQEPVLGSLQIFGEDGEEQAW